MPASVKISRVGFATKPEPLEEFILVMFLLRDKRSITYSKRTCWGAMMIAIDVVDQLKLLL